VEPQANTHMRTATHTFLSWLLMLSMLLAPLQAVMAVDHSQASMSASCLQMMTGDEPVDARSGAATADQATAPCQNPSSPMPCPQMQGCNFSGLNLFPHNGMDSLPRASSLMIRLGDPETRLITRYPDLLQRPPQV
jgi:hypothetical protein